jgi:gamma-glutamylputrescine oxidase
MQGGDSISEGAGWYGEPATPAPERPRLTFDLDVDVCVIGGGLAGLTAAREIGLRGWSVAVLEALTVGSGASGRNVGFVLPGFLEDIESIVERVGLDHAKQLWALSEQGVDYIRALIRDTKMPGVEPVDGWLQVAKFSEDPEFNATATLLREEFGAQVETWPAEQVREHLRSPLYRNGIYFPRAFNINPHNYMVGLAAAAEQAGVRIFEHTPALSVDAAGVRKRIGTPSARVRAAQIVLAANTGLGALMPRLAASLLPVTSYVATTVPFGEQLKQAVTYTGGVSDTDFLDNHYRIVGGDRLVWNGALTMWESDPNRYARQLAGDIERAYPQLAPVEIDHVWSATVGSAVHRMPQIGEVERGVWLSGAYGGQGFNTSAVAGELIARGIADGDETWRLFAPYELVWAGGNLGRAAMQAMYWSRRARERVQAAFNSVPEEMAEPAPAAAAETEATAMIEPVAVDKPMLQPIEPVMEGPNSEAAAARDAAPESMPEQMAPAHDPTAMGAESDPMDRKKSSRRSGQAAPQKQSSKTKKTAASKQTVAPGEEPRPRNSARAEN